MKNDAFRQRETALENEFFQRVDQELLAELRASHEKEVALVALRNASGIGSEQLLNELHCLGVTPVTMMVVSLIPAVLVAWSDGDVDRKEREAIFELAVAEEMTSESPGYKLLQSWLDHQPPPDFSNIWKHYVMELGRALSSEGRKAFVEHIESQATQIAKASGGVLGVGRISSAEQKVLDLLRETFERDFESID